MSNKAIYYKALFLKDVEQAIPEEDENARLLSQHNNWQLRSPRPKKPVIKNNGTTPGPPAFTALQIQPIGSSSTIYTPDSTPAPDSVEWSKRWRRNDRRLGRLNTELLEAIEAHNVEEVERLLQAGANPNATCRQDLVSACHMAAMLGGDSLELLLKFGAEKCRQDRLGRSPLHLAAFAGNARQMAILLDFPEDIQRRVANDDMSSDAEEDVKKISQLSKEMVNVRCNVIGVETFLPKAWSDNIDHDCMDIEGTLPLLQAGWTPLHVAASCARRHCTRLLLAAGANPNIEDETGRTPLDVAGSGYYYGQSINSKYFTDVVKRLVTAGGQFYSMKSVGINVDTPLHTAVELSNMDCINELLEAGASIACLDSQGLTPLHVCVKKQLEQTLKILANYPYKDADPLKAMVDVKDKDGYTVLQAAVKAAWVAGVCIALEAGADVTIRANDGETPIHCAAALGNLDVLNEILSVTKQKDFIDCQNKEGETPLFKAVLNGNLKCVDVILNEGASIKLTMPGDVTVLHVAAEIGDVKLLKYLLEYDNGIAENMINNLTAADRKGLGPIHLAVLNHRVDCVQYLLSKDADIRLRTTDSPFKSSTPLHIAALKNYEAVAKVILAHDRTTIHEVNNMGWYPLHTAGHHGSRDIITLLLQEGADLSAYTDGPKKFRRSAMDMIINNISKPTCFLEKVFDSYISSNSQNFQDSKCEVTVDYRILMPTICEMKQMKVIEALLKTGNRFGQLKLLVHPLVESFLYLKWKALLPFFYTIIAVYALFVGSLTIFTISVFFYKDTQDNPPAILNPNVWGYFVYFTIFLIILQEILYMNVKSTRYFLQLETWIKFWSIALAAVLPPTVAIVSIETTEWPRHVATCALLCSWIELMFLLSRFPNWGYYVLMFGKVASNVIKILLTFAFLVVGFSLSFMIQFRSEIPFDGPWAAFVKTMVMMTSEFDYSALFDKEHSQELATSLVIVRLIFLVFLILAAIVLMNLMVGVAVNDINDLEILGNIRRLVKQVEFLSTLDNLVYNKFFTTILPRRVNNRIKSKRNVTGVITFCPGRSRFRFHKSLPSYLKNAIIDKANEQKKQLEDEFHLEAFRTKIDEMHEVITKRIIREVEKVYENKKEQQSIQKIKFEDIMKRLNSLDENVTKVKGEVKTHVEDTKPIDELNVKMDQMSLEIETVKQFLSRLESKLGSL
ncbi:transient receptor potential channel pyrexia-like isoform X1 [Maniola jurtina]|uniref:transient receptor potential channel pyrexia-like isoform X1 n=1 Tax=Maniola jurtina TaxID=191418 RepID=UPI001E686E14|nr:transient receptor potential channel pyrexia-like isoform X1 [Maniola jurtina]